MAHHGHHGKSQHRQRDVPMPAMPGPRLVVIEPKLGLRRLERILDRPAMPLNRHPSFDPSSGWAPGREERELAIRDAAPDQKPARPQTGLPFGVLAGIEVGQLAIRPVVQPLAFRTVPAERRCQALSSSPAAIASAVPATGGLSPQEVNPSVAFAPSTEPLPARLSLISTSPHPYTASAATQRNGTPAASARSIISSASRGLVAKVVPGGT